MPARSAGREPLLVRVDPETRQALKGLAVASDRSLSQLVRYATAWWTGAAVQRVCPVAGGTGRVNRDEFVNVRFAAEEMAAVRSVGAEMGLGRGAVVRCAVRAWLAAGDFAALGDPRVLLDAPSAPGTGPDLGPDLGADPSYPVAV